MLKNKIARMSNNELYATVASEAAKQIAIAVLAGVAFHVVVRLIAGAVEK